LEWSGNVNKTTKIITISADLLITLIILIKFISILDFIGFDLGVISDFCKIGWNMSGCIFGFIGYGLNIFLYKKCQNFSFAKIILRINAVFCFVVAILDIFMLYISSHL